MNKIAFGVIDAQRGFMPAEEGARLHRDGFGELAVPDGQEIITPTNLIMAAFAGKRLPTFTTQDWHPHTTAHFNEEPNFTTTWPVHCVAGAPGAELHPDLAVPASATRFIKGMECLERGEDDLSYSAYYAEDPTTGHSLPEYLRNKDITTVVLGGLALDYCVGKSAVDIRTKLGLDVAVVTDASRGIAEGSTKDMLDQFDEVGIQTVTTDEVLRYTAVVL